MPLLQSVLSLKQCDFAEKVRLPSKDTTTVFERNQRYQVVTLTPLLPQRATDDYDFANLKRSMGKGKMMVEFFSAEIEFRVCK